MQPKKKETKNTIWGNGKYQEENKRGQEIREGVGAILERVILSEEAALGETE